MSKRGRRFALEVKDDDLGRWYCGVEYNSVAERSIKGVQRESGAQLILFLASA